MFADERLYRTDDPALRIIAQQQTLAVWRMQGRGPRYIKLSGRVLYKGADLNAWLASQAVETAAA